MPFSAESFNITSGQAHRTVRNSCTAAHTPPPAHGFRIIRDATNPPQPATRLNTSRRRGTPETKRLCGRHRNQRRSQSLMADRARFELAGLTPNGFQDRLLRPLGHLSMIVLQSHRMHTGKRKTRIDYTQRHAELITLTLFTSSSDHFACLDYRRRRHRRPSPSSPVTWRLTARADHADAYSPPCRRLRAEISLGVRGCITPVTSPSGSSGTRTISPRWSRPKRTHRV